MIETCAAFGVDGRPPRGAPGLLGRRGRARAPQDRRARAAGRAGDDLPRDRAQRRRRAGRVRPDRPVRDARASCPRRSPPSSAGRTRPRRRPASRRPRPRSRRRSPDAIGAELARRASPAPRHDRSRAAVSQGLFELRKDAITGWWVATVVDRTFERERFALRSAPDRGSRRLLQLPHPAGRRDPDADPQGLRVHGRRHRGGGPGARRAGGPGHHGRRPGGGRVADGRRAAGASTGRCTPSAATSSRACCGAAADEIVASRAGRADAVPPGRPELGRAGGRPHEPPVLRPLRPAPDPAPDRRGARRRRAVPDPGRGVPVLPARPRRGPAPRPAPVRGRRRGRLRPVGQPLAVRGLGGPAPPRRRLRPRHRRRRRRGRPRRSAASSASSPGSLDGPPFNLVLHSAPLHEQVDATYHWHWEIHPRLREIAGLELGTGLPVNPVSPEDAVEELRGEATAAGAPGQPAR